VIERFAIKPAAKPSALFCSAQLGTAGGGVGVVAQATLTALSKRFSVTHLSYVPNRGLLERLRFGLKLWWQLQRGHALHFYSHLDYARVLKWLPRLSSAQQRDVIFLHGIEVWKVLDSGRTWALSHAKLICNSASTLARAQEFLPDLRAEVVHLGAELPNPKAIAKFPERTVLMIGRMGCEERYKGHDQMIDAWPSVRKLIPNAQLLIIGSGNDLLRLQQKAAQIPDIRFEQGLSDEQRDQCIEQAELLAFPSTGEGFGLAAIEAAALALPILALQNTVLAEIFSAESGAYFATAQTPAALTEALVSALSDQERLKMSGQAMQSYVRARYTQEHFETRLFAALDTLGF
jgi:phosphatidyl-myo-inositol dimannoside synthase